MKSKRSRGSRFYLFLLFCGIPFLWSCAPAKPKAQMLFEVGEGSAFGLESSQEGFVAAVSQAQKLFIKANGAASADGATGADGIMVEETADPAYPYPTYEELSGGIQRRIADDASLATDEARKQVLQHWKQVIPEADYKEFSAQSAFECLKIRYMSGGLRVVGYIYKLRNPGDRKYPVVIYNRGGNRELGAIGLREKLIWYTRLAKEGFIVIAPEYRGNDGGEGREQFGGADVRDVMALIPLAKSLPYADSNNIFMYGVSRGGMMTYEAIRNGVTIRAAAVDSGIADLEALGRYRPEMVREVYRQLMPNFAQRSAEHYRLRSAVLFADRIDVPVLILHGAADTRVPASGTLKLAQRLQQLGKNYELVIYAGEEHGLPQNQNDSWPRIVSWFNQFRN